MTDTVTMAHGSGGSATKELIENVFAAEFSNDTLNAMEDSAVVPASEKIALTTDSFVVKPVEYKGGNIGRLSICGTVNDLLMRGSKPEYITAGFILEEGLDIDLLKRIVKSAAETAREAGVRIVAGDTKVIDGNGGIYINTAGVGLLDPAAEDISAKRASDGDVIIVSGNLGDHHSAILTDRLGIDSDIESDNAPLVDIVGNLLKSGVEIHTLRDITRGGLATVLKELAESSGTCFYINENDIPASAAVKSFAAMLGLEPLYMGNEGKLAAVVAAKDAERALEIIRNSKYGADAVIVGEVKAEESRRGRLIVRTEIGSEREVGILKGEGLPRIC